MLAHRRHPWRKMSFDSAMPGSPSVSPNFLIGWGQMFQSCPLVSSIISLKPNSLNFASINHYLMSRIFFHVCSFVSSNVFCVSITSLCNHQLLPRWTAHCYIELSKSSSNILLEKKKSRAVWNGIDFFIISKKRLIQNVVKGAEPSIYQTNMLLPHIVPALYVQ